MALLRKMKKPAAAEIVSKDIPGEPGCLVVWLLRAVCFPVKDR
jgi:hypothetical protein